MRPKRCSDEKEKEEWSNRRNYGKKNYYVNK